MIEDLAVIIGLFGTIIGMLIALINPIIKLNTIITKLNENIEHIIKDAMGKDARLDSHGLRLDALEDKAVKYSVELDNLKHQHELRWERNVRFDEGKT